MEQFKKKFIEEADDLILELEKSLLLLGNNYQDKEIIEKVFRAMHSLKGGSAMFGFKKIDEFTHQLETVYDLVRSGKLFVTDELLEITLNAVDHLKILFAEDENLTQETQKEHEVLINKIIKFLHNNNEEALSVAMNSSILNDGNNSENKTFYILFKPNHDIFKNGTNPLLIIDELVSLGHSKVFTFTDCIPNFDEINVNDCYTYWVVLLSTTATEESVHDVFLFVDMDCELIIKKISDFDLIANPELMDEFNNLFYKNQYLDLNTVENIAREFNEKSNALVKPELKKNDQNKPKELNISSIRVASDKLDELINLVSELVTTQASLTLVSEKIGQKELLVIAEDIEKISRRLRDNTFGIRLIPVENMVMRFQRLVRELSHELNKDIVFHTEGTETELDKTIIESLIDPLMHIIRNSIDHGIETKEVRKKAGKPEQGKITLKAFYSGSNVYIQVSDDGAGMDAEAIRKHAINKGIISAEAVLNQKEILELIFLPGFTTATNITKVSGRGVGMDVVKRKISDIRGEVFLDTKLNYGTTITIKLPLTLSIIDGLLVIIDGTHYVIPLASVDKCFEFKHEQLMNAVNNMIFVNDGHIPFIYLRDEFKAKSTPKEIEQVVVIEYADMRIGLAVDHVVGEYQAVLKSLGKIFKKQDIISGATILGDGTVALVVDPNKIVMQATSKTTSN